VLFTEIHASLRSSFSLVNSLSSGLKMHMHLLSGKERFESS